MTQASPPKAFPLWPLFALLLLGGVLFGGYWFWQRSGHIRFEGAFNPGARLLLANRDGMVLRLEASEGTAVSKGSLLLLFDDSALRKELIQEQEKLARLTALLPPEMVSRTPSGELVPLQQGGVSLSDSLEQQRLEEEKGTARLQAATDNEAAAAILYSRMANLFAQGKASAEDKDTAEAALDAARAEVQEAKKAFEALSLSRAGTGTEIRRIRDYHSSIGADALPADMRARNYAVQYAKVEQLVEMIDNSAIFAPENGTVTKVLVGEGESAAIGQPCVAFLPHSAFASVSADVDKETAARLQQGQQCTIRFADAESAADRQELPGYIRAVFPAPTGQDGVLPGSVRVLVAFNTSAASGPLPFIQGSKADVTVQLREPLLALHTPPAHPAPAPAVVQEIPLADSQTAPQAPPQTVNAAPEPSPPGHAQPVTVQAGSPEAAGKAPVAAEQAPQPLLPPMKAPYPLTGSPYPNPANNPSIVPPETLEPAPARP